MISFDSAAWKVHHYLEPRDRWCSVGEIAKALGYSHAVVRRRLEARMKRQWNCFSPIETRLVHVHGPIWRREYRIDRTRTVRRLNELKDPIVGPAPKPKPKPALVTEVGDVEDLVEVSP